MLQMLSLASMVEGQREQQHALGYANILERSKSKDAMEIPSPPSKMANLQDEENAPPNQTLPQQTTQKSVEECPGSKEQLAEGDLSLRAVPSMLAGFEPPSVPGPPAGEPEDLATLSELVWMLTDPVLDQDDILTVAEEITSLFEFPREALVQPPTTSETVSDPIPEPNNARKRAVLMGLQPYMTSMNSGKIDEAAFIFKATGCKSHKDRATGRHVYTDEVGVAVAPEVFASRLLSSKVIMCLPMCSVHLLLILISFERYSACVESRREERWVASTSTVAWFSDVELSEVEQLSPPATSPRQSVDRGGVSPPVADGDAEPPLPRARKTLSPSQVPFEAGF